MRITSVSGKARGGTSSVMNERLQGQSDDDN